MERKQTDQEAARAEGMTCAEYRSVMTAGMEARQQLVVHNLPLVVSQATKFNRAYEVGLQVW